MANGSVRQVIGTVVDVEFPSGSLPDLYNAVEIDMGSTRPKLVAGPSLATWWTTVTGTIPSRSGPRTGSVRCTSTCGRPSWP